MAGADATWRTPTSSSRHTATPGGHTALQCTSAGDTEGSSGSQQNAQLALRIHTCMCSSGIACIQITNQHLYVRLLAAGEAGCSTPLHQHQQQWLGWH